MSFDPQSVQEGVSAENRLDRALTKLFRGIADEIERGADEGKAALSDLVSWLRDSGQSVASSVMANTGLPNPTGEVGYSGQAQGVALAAEGGAPPAAEVPVQPHAPAAVQDSAFAGGVPVRAEGEPLEAETQHPDEPQSQAPAEPVREEHEGAQESEHAE